MWKVDDRDCGARRWTTRRLSLQREAVFGVEVQNEDSFFFWTFDAKNIPDAQLRIALIVLS